MMLFLPDAMITVLGPLAPVFQKRVFERVKLLVEGALLVPGQRTVAAVLRVMGHADDSHFQNYHRVLNRDRWSSRTLSKILLHLLIAAFVSPEEPILVGIDEHICRYPRPGASPALALRLFRNVRIPHRYG